MEEKKRVAAVFGVSNKILPDSYVDRGALDERIGDLLSRPTHIALRGESKCGKSWLRQRNIPDALTVQCRFNTKATDIYVDALSQLGIKLTIEDTTSSSLKGTIEARGELGLNLLAKIGLKMAGEQQNTGITKAQAVGHNIDDLRFVADVLKASGRRLVIEDFHYMSVDQRRSFAFDLKALWDYGVFVVVIGVWSQSNMLIYLNPDLAGRIEELSIYWSPDDLKAIIEKGGAALKLQFNSTIVRRAIDDCFGNAGILQKLILGTLDNLNIKEEAATLMNVGDINALESAEMSYADQLTPLYQQFAKSVSRGIRNRENSTGIYAHAIAVILEAPDEQLMKGLHLDTIFDKAHDRQDRIQKGNLGRVLQKFEELQVDDGGRGLVLSYNEATSEITVVDRQLLLYRRYATVKWPWEDIIAEADRSDKGFEA